MRLIVSVFDRYAFWISEQPRRVIWTWAALLTAIGVAFVLLAQHNGWEGIR